jgi:GNAT superfamily N-acetyltransferase
VAGAGGTAGPTADVSVRRARGDDVAALGEVHARAWRAAYASLLPDEALQALDPRALALAWRPAVLEPPGPGHEVLVACAGPTVVALAAVAPATDADTRPGLDGELVALLVDPSAQGAGHGSRLLAAAVDRLQAAGAVRVLAWCPTADGARRRFLRSAGLAEDGARRVLDLPGDGRLEEVRLSALIADPGADGAGDREDAR